MAKMFCNFDISAIFASCRQDTNVQSKTMLQFDVPTETTLQNVVDKDFTAAIFYSWRRDTIVQSQTMLQTDVLSETVLLTKCDQSRSYN